MDPAPIRRKQADRSATARRKILDATVELLGIKGFEGFSLAEVGERAGVSRALPGHYFKTRDKVISEAVRGLLAVPEPSEVGLEGLLGSLERSLGKVGSTRVQALLITLAAPSGRSPAPDGVVRYWEASERWMEHHLRAGISAGEVREDMDPTATARMLVAAIYGEALIASSQRASVTAPSGAKAFKAGIRKFLTPYAPAAAEPPYSEAAVEAEAPKPKSKRRRKPTPTALKYAQSDLFGNDEAAQVAGAPE